ncbi:MAG TPA: (Fe-S)-binding protein [Bacteroidia bacterium]|nr:(Fe-S)-binding protein [Bacteroidia bacterium]HRG51220.1 (Fe-S)-binding protein [Bacteroidia bacterium]
MISSILFILLLIGGVVLFTLNVRKVIRNIRLGKEIDRTDQPGKRWNVMARVALGQSKMVTRPVPAILHIFVYIGFVIINIEVVEMFVDGIFGTHRFLSFTGGFYNFLIGSFEILAFLVTFGCVVFLIRRNVVHVKRLISKELNGWPKTDANLILITEILLMSAFFIMNACDSVLLEMGSHHYNVTFSQPISQLLKPIFTGMSENSLIAIERFCWWFHVIGIIGFLNYLPYSKHFHILLAFPNVYYSNLKPKGAFTNLQSVTNEVKAMMDPSFVPPAADPNVPLRFGAKDVTDLTWKQLLDAYTCTECGRCTSSCPANITGKLLSPRKIMMDTRDRLTEVGKNIDQNKGEFKDDGKALLGNYITPEELWACTSCNACVQECPVNIDPLSIIMDMRRYIVMEQSAAPTELNGMFTNTENNGAPWQFSPSDRLNWTKE